MSKSARDQIRIRLVFAVVVAFWTGTVHAQEAVTDLQPLPEAESAQIEEIRSEIELKRADIALIVERIATLDDDANEILQLILGERRDQIWSELIEEMLRLAVDIADYSDAGFDVSAYRDNIVQNLRGLPEESRAALERLAERAVLPTADLAPNVFVFRDQELFEAARSVDSIYRSMLMYIDVANRFGLDGSAESEFLAGAIADSAETRSVFLEIARTDVRHLRSAVATLPDDTDLAAWLGASETRVAEAAAALEDIVSIMNAAGLETRLYRRQVLTVTGEITTDILDVGIVASLVGEWSQELLDYTAAEGPRWIFRFLLVALILFFFIQFSKLVTKGVEKAMNSSRNRMSYLLRRMIISSVRNLIVIVGVLIAISQLGISLAPLLTGLGIAGFIIGFALQDSLSNFASGVMILMYRPFDVGDVVDSAGVRGRVSSMSLVNTTFMTLDNQRLVVPNNMIWQSVITNVTAQRTRRVDLIFGISYSDDIEKAESVLADILSKHENVLDDPEPVVKVHELGESSVNFAVRPWVKTSQYWDTYWDLTREVKLRFDKEGISIPFPQRDVHVMEQKLT